VLESSKFNETRNIYYVESDQVRREMDLEYFRSLQKCELHAHLSGSIRTSTLREFAEEAKLDLSAYSRVLNDSNRSLTDCFDIFSIIHKVVRTRNHVQRLVHEMVEDALVDNVIYLEIRTTPRVLDDYDKGKDDLLGALAYYIDGVIEAVEKAERFFEFKVEVRILVSLDRGNKVPFHVSTLDLVRRYHLAGNKYIVGVDVSGDPSKHDISPLIPLLQELRRDTNGQVKISFHVGEVMNVRETNRVLDDLSPDRLGHACVLSHSSVEKVLEKKIPIEICPTSNAMTLHLPSFEHHPLMEKWIQEKHPVAICTDDSGVFNVTLSEELMMLAKEYRLGSEQVEAIASGALELAFCDEETKERLRRGARS
jgi:adenosine deaminase